MGDESLSRSFRGCSAVRKGIWLRSRAGLPGGFCGPQGVEEASPVGNRRAKIFGNGLAHVREGVAHTEICSSTASRGVGENGNIFARGFRPPPARVRITAVVRGDQQQIGKAEQRQEISEHAVKLFKRFLDPFELLA